MRHVRDLVIGAALLFAASAVAHADVLRLEPATDGVVVGAPSELTIHFTMAVEPRFSTFKVYRLAVDDDALPTDLAAPTERDRMRLNALAAGVVSEALGREDDADDPHRVDDAAPTVGGAGTAVTLTLTDDLPPGVYVVMWEVLAIDTHWTSGHRLVFVAAAPD